MLDPSLSTKFFVEYNPAILLIISKIPLELDQFLILLNLPNNNFNKIIISYLLISTILLIIFSRIHAFLFSISLVLIGKTSYKLFFNYFNESLILYNSSLLTIHKALTPSDKKAIYNKVCSSIYGGPEYCPVPFHLIEPHLSDLNTESQVSMTVSSLLKEFEQLVLKELLSKQKTIPRDNSYFYNSIDWFFQASSTNKFILICAFSLGSYLTYYYFIPSIASVFLSIVRSLGFEIKRTDDIVLNLEQFNNTLDISF